MTKDKARKTATRQRMADTGEPYSVARHAVEDEYASSADPRDGMAEDAGAAEARTRPQEQAEGAMRLAEQARAAAEQARSRAEQAERLADEAEDAADRAEQAADEAGNLVNDSDRHPPRRHHRSYRSSRPAHPPRPPRPERPATPPRPPRPPRGPHGQDDWPHRPDPAELLQDRLDQFIQRLSVARDQADRLIRAAERIFTPARSEPTHSEPVRPEPVHSEPPAAEPGPEPETG